MEAPRRAAEAPARRGRRKRQRAGQSVGRLARGRVDRLTRRHAGQSGRAAHAPVVLRGPLCLQSRAHQGFSREICNVIHYQTIGKRKAGRHATLFIIKPSASEKSPSVIGPVSSTDGVCIGILRSEANSQQTEIDREIKMYFNK